MAHPKNKTLDQLIIEHRNLAYQTIEKENPLTFIGYSNDKKITIYITYKDILDKKTKLDYVMLVFHAFKIEYYTCVTYGLIWHEEGQYQVCQASGKSLLEYPDAFLVFSCVGVSHEESKSILYKFKNDKLVKFVESYEAVEDTFTHLLPDKNLTNEDVLQAEKALDGIFEFEKAFPNKNYPTFEVEDL